MGTPLTVASTVEVSAEFCWPPQAASRPIAGIRNRERSAIRMESPRGLKTSIRFVGCQRLNTECVDIGLPPIAERSVHHAMALQAALGCKRRRHDAHRIMSVSRMRMADVLGAIVADVEPQRSELRLQPFAQKTHAVAHGKVLRNGLTATLA